MALLNNPLKEDSEDEDVLRQNPGMVYQEPRDSTDSDSDDGEAPPGYEALPTEPLDSEEPGTRDSSESGLGTWHSGQLQATAVPDCEIPEAEESPRDMTEGNGEKRNQQVEDDERHRRVEEVKERDRVYAQPDTARDIEMTTEKVAAIKTAMKSLKLPSMQPPPWADEISDHEWTNVVRKNLSSKK